MTSVTHVLRSVPRLYEEEPSSIKAISRRFGISRALVTKRLVTAGIRIRSKSELNLLLRNRALPHNMLRELYLEKRVSASAIARRVGCSRQHVVNRLGELRIPLRSLADACTRYPKVRFNGNAIERAYLIGFRTGDLHVKRLNSGGCTIWVETASTRAEQIQLFLKLFQPYGHCWVGGLKKSGARGVHALVDESFEFLLLKPNRISPEILRSRQRFAAFLAGYVDAEGHFGVYDSGPVLAIQSYDRDILVQIFRELRRLGIPCLRPWVAALPGTLTNRNGYSNKKTVWRLSVARRQTLLEIIGLLKPYIRHAKRRADMLAVERHARKAG